MKHIERRILSHTPKNLFKLVSDVKKYPEFLPWCLGARVNNCTETELNADLIIGFKIYKEVYSSQILLDHKDYIVTLMKPLENKNFFDKMLLFCPIQIQTVPIGLSLVPPLGPAIPVTAIDI